MIRLNALTAPVCSLPVSSMTRLISATLDAALGIQILDSEFSAIHERCFAARESAGRPNDHAERQRRLCGGGSVSIDTAVRIAAAADFEIMRMVFPLFRKGCPRQPRLERRPAAGQLAIAFATNGTITYPIRAVKLTINSCRGSGVAVARSLRREHPGSRTREVPKSV